MFVPTDVFASAGRDGSVMIWDARNSGVSSGFEGIYRQNSFWAMLTYKHESLSGQC